MNCQKCKHRQILVGTHHSSCHCPITKDIYELPIAPLMQIDSKMCPIEVVIDLAMLASAHGIAINSHGILKGWATWPFSYDSVWIDNCIHFEEKEQ